MTALSKAGGVTLTDDEVARFWALIDVGDEDECWVWKSRGYQRDGKPHYPYFQIYRNGKRFVVGADVLALALKLGHDDFDLAAHSCDNKRCANPNHLSAGTPSSNARETWARIRVRARERGQLVFKEL